jgi:hypothetical protein
MKKPRSRSNLPPRISDNDKRRLDAVPGSERMERLLRLAHYRGTAKHKAHPQAFGLPPSTKPRGDATLCDAHAGFGPDAMESLPRLLRRGIKAGLIGPEDRMLWTIGDDGWIFEGRITNAEQAEYHGYPVRPGEGIAGKVYERYRAWADGHGDDADRSDAACCRQLYGFLS